MATTWIVSCDSSRARVLQVTGRDRLEEIEDLVNPAARIHDRELRTDSHPRYNGHGGVGKAGSAATGGPGNDREEMTAAEVETEKFAKQIGRYLEKARMDHRYDRLFLLAPPRFLGMIRKELGKEVQKLVIDEIDKDVTSLPAGDLARYIEKRA
jgi:protein required for attachment to host cells